MADTGVKYPATVSTVQETGDDNDWVTPAEVVSDNGVYGNITAASFDANDLSYLLRATNPSMGVPAGSTIDGILVEIERYYAAGTVADYDVCLTKDGSTRVGDDKSTGAQFPTSPAVTSFGGATDLWGTTWTVDEINATTFGVLYKMQATGANADGFVDFIRITVYYTGGLTAIGDTVQKIWHIRQTIGDTNQFVYHIKALTSDTIQHIWNVKSAIADILQQIWHIWSLATKTIQIIHNIRAIIADTSQYIWNIKTIIGDAVQKTWNVRAIIGNTNQYVWHIKQVISQIRQAIWNVLAGLTAVGNTFELVFNIRATIYYCYNALRHWIIINKRPKYL